ncbi:MAG: MlaD family protein [Deltaproteobacteria bacterium]|jgi:phospholipid/cholesterol/gamma-HCH transport system substrate-binding protein/paraquat-inducible protein B|nr:MlaD family protein [Deltaproteobacteria bacterium]
MSGKSSYFKVGVFSIAAFAVLAAGIIFFGISQAYQPVLNCSTLFDHSVQGLGNGSPVSFRGFHVGQVTSVSVVDGRLAAGASPADAPKKLVKVTFSVTPKLITGKSSSKPDDAMQFIVKEMQTGLRCFFNSNLVSGVSNLNLDYLSLAPPIWEEDFAPSGARAAEPPPSARDSSGKGALSPREPISLRGGELGEKTLNIPSAPGSIMELGDSLNQILKSVRDVDFRRISVEATDLLNSLNQILTSLNRQTGGFSDELIGTLSSVRAAGNEIARLAATLNTTVSGLSDGGGGLAQLEGALRDARKTMTRLDAVLRIPQATLPATMDNLRVMSENLRTLSETARDYPSSIILGSPPPPMER